MSRRNEIYVSKEVSKALWLLSRAETGTVISPSGEPRTQGISPDEIADTYLRERITADYPQLFEHQREIDKLEKKLIESLKK